MGPCKINRKKTQNSLSKLSLNSSIDEFSIGKRHKYMTIVIDFQTGRIIHAVSGKSKKDILPFLKKLSKKAKKLKAVSIDMGAAYIAAVIEAFENVDIVIDHFHVTKLFNDALDDFRRELNRAYKKLGENTLKGSRFLLLSNFENLKHDKQIWLNKLLRINEPLFVIYSMKEQLRLFWQYKDKDLAADFLSIWCKTALKSGIKQLMRVGATLAGMKTALLNYFKHFISSGKIEGTINKIKTLKRQAYGFRDKEYFKLRLYHLHYQKYSLTG